MPLIGLATASVVSTIVFVRVTRPLNKFAVFAIWAITTAYYFGLRP